MTNAFDWLTVDPASAVPPYEQLRQSVAAAVAEGRLVAGTKLPTVRALAAQLGLAVNTVAKAYRELEQAGVVQTKSRAGTVVSAAGDQARAKVAEAARIYANVVRANGFSDDDALRYVQAALEAK
jgi:DNA-binding transcriptional regulator YhcF (GntR family)